MSSARGNNSAIIPVILAGGGGTRLWPLSTSAAPKQFHAVIGAQTLLEQTLQRVVERDNSKAQNPRYAAPLVITGTRYGTQVRAAAQQAGCAHAQLLLEPTPRNTGPAIAAAALLLAHRAAPETDPLMLVLSADHHIADPAALHRCVGKAEALARTGALVTFGIVPQRAETGYGYIRQGAAQGAGFEVEGFFEKPDQETAQKYLDQGGYFWNGGIFLFSVSAILAAFEAHAPDILDSASKAIDTGNGKHIFTLGAGAFARCPALSIDVAVMERAKNVAMVPAQMGWADIGSWSAVAQIAPRDGQNNSTKGQVLAIDATGCHGRTDAGLLALVGVSDLVVVRAGDVVLVTASENGQAAKQAQTRVAKLRAGDVAPSEPLDLQRQAARIKTWMQAALPLWADAGWDAGFGGFHEYLTLTGQPPEGATTRLRVQARQIFVYSKVAAMAGVGGAGDDERFVGLAQTALENMQARGWQAEGGWVHSFLANGDPHDTQRDTYDHAFVLLCLAWAYRATGDADILVWARRTLAYLDAVLADPLHGGYFEAVPDQSPRRANPHMHLLEAMLALFDATGDFTFLDRASEIVALFNRCFHDRKTGSVAEFFDRDWRPAPGQSGQVREPGHNYEWASLLAIYAYKSGVDCTETIAQLFEFAEILGLAPHTGLAFDQILDDGTVSDPNHRLWPQTEALRAAVLMARTGHPNATARAARLVDTIFEIFLDPMPAGLWIDQVDAAGKPISQTVPASTFYHLLTAFSAVLEAVEA
ncbi:MAG: AGE family epimerase/isomerase [Alphaproteobacteria bacterium]